MRIDRNAAAVIALALLTGVAGCGSYSAPNNTAPDSSSSDSMPKSPGPAYDVR